jgi:hypothetical protein
MQVVSCTLVVTEIYVVAHELCFLVTHRLQPIVKISLAFFFYVIVNIFVTLYQKDTSRYSLSSSPILFLGLIDG